MGKQSSSKLSEEEKKRRLREMEENAKWRSDIRNKNIKTYKQDVRKEDEEQERDQSVQKRTEAANLFKYYLLILRKNSYFLVLEKNKFQVT